MSTEEPVTTEEAHPTGIPEAQRWLAAYNAPSLGSGVAVEDLTLRLGHMTLRLTSGRAAPVIVGGETVGFFFSGSGDFEYVSDRRVESTVMDLSIRKKTQLDLSEADEGLTVRGSVERVFVLAGGAKLPALDRRPPLEAPAEAVLKEAWEDHREHFTRVYVPPPAHQLVQARLDAPGKPLIRAEIATGKDDLLFTFDTVRAGLGPGAAGDHVHHQGSLHPSAPSRLEHGDQPPVRP